MLAATLPPPAPTLEHCYIDIKVKKVSGDKVFSLNSMAIVTQSKENPSPGDPGYLEETKTLQIWEAPQKSLFQDPIISNSLFYLGGNWAQTR